MTPSTLWTDKLAQFFHDPFWKAWCQGQTAKELARWLGGDVEGEIEELARWLGGDVEGELKNDFWDRFAQDKVGMLLSRRMLGEEFVFPDKWRQQREAKRLAQALQSGSVAAQPAADLAMTGADRPVLGGAREVYVKFWKEGNQQVTVTHPLSADSLQLPVPPHLPGLKNKLAPSLRWLDTYRALLADVSAPERHRRAALLAWRRLPEDLAAEDGRFWPLQPADTRCPDHSIWDHLRLSSALGFLSQSEAADYSKRIHQATADALPWLLSAWVGPARDFLGQARTGRDLWTGSVLLAELAWAMVEPVAQALGPDAVLYPDLRANPRADRWLAEAHPGVLAGAAQGSRASLIPNRFVAVIPQAALDDLLPKLRQAVEQRWAAMAQAVHAHLSKALGPGPWESLFQRQVEAAPVTRWVAVPWTWDGSNSKVKALTQHDITLPPSIPFQAHPPGLPKALEPIEEARQKRFRGWIHADLYHHYQAARWTFLQTQPAHLQKLSGAELDTADRNIERARFLRRHLNKDDGAEQN